MQEFRNMFVVYVYKARFTTVKRIGDKRSFNIARLILGIAS